MVLGTESGKEAKIVKCMTGVMQNMLQQQKQHDDERMQLFLAFQVSPTYSVFLMPLRIFI